MSGPFLLKIQFLYVLHTCNFILFNAISFCPLRGHQTLENLSAEKFACAIIGRPDTDKLTYYNCSLTASPNQDLIACAIVGRPITDKLAYYNCSLTASPKQDLIALLKCLF